MGFRIGWWKGPFGFTFGQSGPRFYARGNRGCGCMILSVVGLITAVVVLA